LATFLNKLRMLALLSADDQVAGMQAVPCGAPLIRRCVTYMAVGQRIPLNETWANAPIPARNTGENCQTLNASLLPAEFQI
jgi:hypothetical protein